jgi:hypothetical protein
LEKQGAHIFSSVEAFPRGYPQLAAFQASDPAFSMFRRFGMLQTRCLLYQQERLAALEAELNKIDSEEKVQLYLSSRIHDRNERRKTVLEDIQHRLREYSMYPLSKIVEGNTMPG